MKIKPDLIITSDWHLMEEERNPPCRLDNIWEAQWDKVKQVFDLQNSFKYKPEIFHAGDLFEHWKTSPNLLNKLLSIPLPNYFYTIIGNHDLPQHNLDLLYKSGLKTILNSSKYREIDGIHWGQEITEEHYLRFGKRKVVMAHLMTYQGTKPWPGCEDPECKEIFKLFPKADLIITGHNHKTFVERKGNQLLINPGSLTRHKADQIDHKPCVFLWEAKTNKYEIHYLKVKENVISREHIQEKKEKEEKISAFISKLNNDWDISLSFERNMEKALQKKVPEKIKQLIYEWMGL